MADPYLLDPDENLDFSIDYSALLETGEAIAASTWTVELGDVELGSGAYTATNDASSTTVWLTGGVAGAKSKVMNEITTDSSPPRVIVRSIHIVTREK